MEGYSVTEAASVLGVPTERVWELLARGILSGAPDGETGMRVFLQPRPAPAPPAVDEPRQPNGGRGREPEIEASPFRELLTEFRNLTERYGQALLALGEARGEVASLRSRVDLLEARFDLRLPMAGPMPSPTPSAAWSSPPPAPQPEVQELAQPAETDRAEAPPEATDARPRRKRGRGHRRATDDFAEALARAEDPNPAELPGAAEAAAALAALREEAAAVEPEPERATTDFGLPRELPAAEPMEFGSEPGSVGAVEPGATADDLMAQPAEPVVDLAPEPAVAAAEPEREEAVEALEPEREEALEALEAEPQVAVEPADAPEPEAVSETAVAAEAHVDVGAEVIIAEHPFEPEPEPPSADATEAEAAAEPEPQPPEFEPPEEEPAPEPAVAEEEPEPTRAATVEPEPRPGPTRAVVGPEPAREPLTAPEPPADADLVADAETWPSVAAGTEQALSEPEGRVPGQTTAPPPEPEPEGAAEASWDRERYSARIEEPDWIPEERETVAQAPAAAQEPTATGSAQGVTEEPQQQEDGPLPPPDVRRADEETVRWFERDLGLAPPWPQEDDPAAEIEVASMGTHTTAPPESPTGPEPAPESRPATTTPPATPRIMPTTPARPLTPAGPASRAYRRLRRIFPG